CLRFAVCCLCATAPPPPGSYPLSLHDALPISGFIVENLRKAFPDTDETGELDLILFAGDVFDRLLSFPSTEASEAADWFMDFLAMCQRRDIVVRVLEGTPSHDWKQSSFFVGLNRNLLKPADFKYV